MSVICPKCNTELPVSVVAQIKDESRIAMAVTPADGELFDLRTIGGVLTNFAKVLEACGRQTGFKALVLLEGIDCEPDGKMTFRAIVCRTGNRKVRQ